MIIVEHQAKGSAIASDWGECAPNAVAEIWETSEAENAKVIDSQADLASGSDCGFSGIDCETCMIVERVICDGKEMRECN